MVFQNNLLMGAASISTGGFSVDNSCRFNDDDSAVLTQTFSGAPTSDTTQTYSYWVKRGNLDIQSMLISNYTGGAKRTAMGWKLGWVTETDEIGIQYYESAWRYVIFSPLFRDPSAWYNLVFVVDTTNGTAADRLRLYVNGVRVTDVKASSYPTSSEATPFLEASDVHNLGANETSGGKTGYWDGYMSQVCVIDGQALAPTSFGEFDDYGVWRPIDVSGLTFGNNGFLLDFTDSSDLGNDVSGNNNDFTSSGLASNDQSNDTPTKNYPTFATNNGNYASGVGPANTISNGNLDLVGGESAFSFCDVNFTPLTSGKWYWTQASNTVYDYNLNLGIVNEANRSNGITSTSYDNSGTGAWALSWAGPPTPADQLNFMVGGGSNVLGDLSPTPTAGAQMVLAVDIDNLKIWAGWWDDDNDNLYWMASDASFSSANVDVPGTGSDETASLVGTGFTLYTGNYSTRGGVIDFGSVNGGILSNITQPSGFNQINTANLATPTILDGTANFQPTLYTGNGSVRNIDQTGNSTFQPDFVWIKNRSEADDNMLVDAARGATKELNSNSTAAESTDSNGLTSFDSDGFGLGSGAGGYNDNTEDFVGWQWLAGGGAGSSNEDGTINTTTTTVNTTAGFSISTYTGTGAGSTIGHGLGAIPELIIIHRLDSTNNWAVYHGSNTSAPQTDWLALDETVATADNHTVWNDTAPTSSVFSIGTGLMVNGSTATYVAYVWTSITGYSQFGSYEGNDDADGTVVYTGFRPGWLMIKDIDSAGTNWNVWDSTRSPFNLGYKKGLRPNSTQAEHAASIKIDFLANGFKCRDAGGDINDAETYIYAAFASNPFGGADITPNVAY